MAEQTGETPDSLLSALAATPDAVLPRGTTIDAHYRVERVIGQGGMGVVYLARDLRLERDVAIKVGVARAALGQLAREALALARLSHPNVVVVHEVGEHDGRAYVAMEYVPGGTARAWCKGRAARDVIALYAAAGDGLAAAHAAGLVHRDFKPDNVLVGADGRPRVADFGLALPARGDRGGGTPAYMAPEQRGDGEVDARADQYAFCVSLWEALTGARPGAGERAAAALPRRVELALRRGLADDPNVRWPAIAALVAELRGDRSQRRVAAVAALAGVAAVAMVVVGVATARHADPCADVDPLAWSPDAVRAALAPPGAPAWRARDADGVVARLATWVDRHAVATRDVCRGSPAWPPRVQDRGTACLARRAHQLAAALDVLAGGAAAPDGADRVLDELAAPETCADPAYLAAAVAPVDPARAVGARDLEDALDRAHARSLAGAAVAVRAEAPALVARADALGYAPLAARARYERGFAIAAARDEAAALDDLRDAYFAARREQDAELAAAAASASALALRRLSRDPQASDWARLAEVDAIAATSPRAEQLALDALAVTATDRGDFPAALAYAERDLALARDAPDSLATALDVRARVRRATGALPEALADLDAAARAIRDRYGDTHPRLEPIASDRALVLETMHRVDHTDEAVAAAREAERIATAVDPGGTLEDDAQAVLAVALQEARRYDEALAAIDRSLALTRAHDGPRGYNVASDLNNRAEVLMRLHRLDDALASWADAADIFAEVVGPSGFEVALVDLNRANALIAGGRARDAEAPARHVLAIARADTVIYAKAEIALGVVLLGRADLGAAKDALTRGLADNAAHGDDPNWRARGWLALAHVLAATGDRAGARELATKARPNFVASGERATGELADVDALLKSL